MNTTYKIVNKAKYNKTNKNIHDYPNDDIRGITFAYKYVVLNWGGVCQMLTTCQFCLD